MSFEQIPNVTQRIETDDVHERDAELQDRIVSISLAYADKKYQELHEKTELLKFSDCVKLYSPVQGAITSPVFHEDRRTTEQDDLMVNATMQAFMDTVDEAYASGGWRAAETLYKEAIDPLREYAKNRNEENDPATEKEAKVQNKRMVSNNMIHEIDHDMGGRYVGIEQFGFSPTDELMEIHIESAFKLDDQTVGIDRMKQELGRVAERIVDEFPQCAAVVGSSWLMDTPIAKRLGFTTLPEMKMPMNVYNTWLQMIDKNGQIDQKRLKKLMETGELPYRNTVGYIKTEDFLRIYLPKEKRGVITLKEKNAEGDEEFKRFREEGDRFAKDWDRQLKERNSIDFDELLSVHPHVFAILKQAVDQDEYDQMLEFFRTMADQKVPQKETGERGRALVGNLMKKANEYFDRMRYADKMVDLTEKN